MWMHYVSDTVASFLPPGVSMPANGGEAITLQQLATHTSSLPNTPPNLPATIEDYANQFANYELQDLYDFLNGYTLPRAPGSVWEYSNTGIALLGHVLALSQSSDFETLLRQRVLDPMFLFDTAIELTPGQASRTAPGHHGVVQRPPFEMNSLAAAGALKSCAYDLGTYLEYNLGIRSGSVTPGLQLAQELFFDLPDGTYDYDLGLGWWLWDGGDIVQHGGDSFGSTAFVGFNRNTEVGVVVLSNNRAHYPASISDIGFHCLDESEPLDSVPTAAPIPEETLRELVGDYGFVRFEMIHGRPVLDIPSQIGYTAYSDGAGGFKVLDVGLEIDLDFQSDPASGEITSITLIQNGGEPVVLPRIRSDGRLAISIDPASDAINLSVADGEGDREYPLECSADLQTWSPLGTIDIWESREETMTDNAKYFRIREP